MPRWDTKKFEGASRNIGTAMKSIGEVMAIGRNFEEAVQKAARMLNIRYDGVIRRFVETDDLDVLRERLRNPTDQIIFDVVEALMVGHARGRGEPAQRHRPLVRQQVQEHRGDVQARYPRPAGTASRGTRRWSARRRSSGSRTSRSRPSVGMDEEHARAMRERMGVKPFTKTIDTLAAEWPAKTNYLYMTYNASEEEAKPTDAKKVLVLGRGAVQDRQLGRVRLGDDEHGLGAEGERRARR